jgi:hypothetical protein
MLLPTIHLAQALCLQDVIVYPATISSHIQLDQTGSFLVQQSVWKEKL